MHRLGLFTTGLLFISLSITGCSTLSNVPKHVATSVKETFVATKPDEPQAKQYFAQAEQQFTAASKLPVSDRTSGFESAVSPYKRAAKLAPNTPLEEDALMMVGESHFFADEYVAAGTAYDELIALYPNTRHMEKIDNRRFSIAQHWLAMDKRDTIDFVPNLTNQQRPTMDTFGYAVKMLDRIRFDDPTGKLADDATMAAAIANFERRKYGAADILFTDIRQNFPSSEHQFRAHLIGLKAKQMMYAGPEYDGTVLDEAEAIIKQMFRLFPNDIQPHEQYLKDAYKDLRLKKANREFVMAQFYDNRKEYGAARLYYNRVQKEYPDTSLAQGSRTRLQAIGGLPDEPEQQLEWLAKAFPEDNGKAKPLLARETPLLRR